MRFLDENFVKPEQNKPQGYVQPGEGAGVSETAKTRIEGQSAALRTLGIDPGGPRTEAGYAIGTRALQNTVTGRLREERLEAASMPPAVGALEALRDRAKGLNTKSREVPLFDLASTAQDGRMFDTRGVETPLIATADAWSHLGAMYGAAGLSSYLPVADPAIRAQLCKHHSDKIRQDYYKASDARTEENIRRDSRKLNPLPAAEARQTVLSVRNDLSTGKPHVYRVASPGYKPFEVVDACEALLASDDVKRALAGARAAIKWDGRRATLDLIWTADEGLYTGLGDFAAGDTFQYAQRIVLDEVKSGSTEHYSFSRRNECLNMIIISTRRGDTQRWRHAGEAGATVAGGLLARLREHRAAVDSFVGTWVSARRDRILDEMSLEPSRMFGALLCEGLIDLPGLRTTEKKVDALCAAFAKEPGQSLADVVNAATRASHEGDWWNSSEAMEESEVQAGQLLYVKNLRARVTAGLSDYDASNGDDTGAGASA